MKIKEMAKLKDEIRAKIETLDTAESLIVEPQEIGTAGLIRITHDPHLVFDKKSVPNQLDYATAKRWSDGTDRFMRNAKPNRCQCEIVSYKHGVELSFHAKNFEETIDKAVKTLARMELTDDIGNIPKSYPKTRPIESLSDATFPWSYYPKKGLYPNLPDSLKERY